MTLPKPLHGVITPLATPLLDRDRLDGPALDRMVEKIIAGGVTGIFVLGTTGEALGLSHRLRKEILHRVCSAAGDRAPVLASITDTSIIESLNFADEAMSAGASGLVLAPPYYYETTQPELLRYVETVSREAPLPIYLYNIPHLTKTHYSPEVVRAAADLPNVWGIKDSSGDMDYFAELIRRLADRPEFAVLCGPEERLAEAIALGAHGGIAGGSNLAPELFVELCHAATNGDAKRVAEIQTRVMRISKGVYHASAEGSSYLRGMKCALSLLGSCRNIMAEPYQPFGPAETETVRIALAGAGLLPELIGKGA
jgi:dihydrodipicolinate synthase/N-acetylneuraminate lyase